MKSLKDGLYFVKWLKQIQKFNICQRFGYVLPSSGHKMLLKLDAVVHLSVTFGKNLPFHPPPHSLSPHHHLTTTATLTSTVSLKKFLPCGRFRSFRTLPPSSHHHCSNAMVGYISTQPLHCRTLLPPLFIHVPVDHYPWNRWLSELGFRI